MMNFKVFWLIHNERSYKRYYYQPNDVNHPNRLGWLFELKWLISRYIKAAYLPFNPKYNTQQVKNQSVAEMGGVESLN